MNADRLVLPPGADLPEALDILEARTAVAYWKADDRWMIWLPGGGLGDLSLHDVTEHDDGTITVGPSILVSGHTGSRHGYLERGVWRDD